MNFNRTLWFRQDQIILGSHRINTLQWKSYQHYLDIKRKKDQLILFIIVKNKLCIINIPGKLDQSLLAKCIIIFGLIQQKTYNIFQTLDQIINDVFVYFTCKASLQLECKLLVKYAFVVMGTEYSSIIHLVFQTALKRVSNNDANTF